MVPPAYQHDTLSQAFQLLYPHKHQRSYHTWLRVLEWKGFAYIRDCHEDRTFERTTTLAIKEDIDSWEHAMARLSVVLDCLMRAQERFDRWSVSCVHSYRYGNNEPYSGHYVWALRVMFENPTDAVRARLLIE